MLELTNEICLSKWPTMTWQAMKLKNSKFKTPNIKSETQTNCATKLNKKMALNQKKKIEQLKLSRPIQIVRPLLANTFC